jgi:hypothetical protein
MPDRVYLFFRGILWENLEFEPVVGWETEFIEHRPATGDGTFLLDLNDPDGRTMLTVSPEVDFWRTTTVNSTGMAFDDVRAYVPLVEGARELVFRRGDQVISREEIADEPPTIEITEVGNETRGRVHLSWGAAGATGRPLRFHVVYLLEDGRGFFVGRNLKRKSMSADLRSLPGGRARFAVLATDGRRSGRALSDWFEISARPPAVWINTPEEGQLLPPDQPVSLLGMATDVAGQPLSDERLEWRVDGETVARQTRTATVLMDSGRHEIELAYARDGGGGVVASITVTVLERNTDQSRLADVIGQSGNVPDD